MHETREVDYGMAARSFLIGYGLLPFWAACVFLFIKGDGGTGGGGWLIIFSLAPSCVTLFIATTTLRRFTNGRARAYASRRPGLLPSLQRQLDINPVIILPGVRAGSPQTDGQSAAGTAPALGLTPSSWPYQQRFEDNAALPPGI